MKQLGIVLGSVSAIAVLTVAPVWAEHGVSAEGDMTSSNSGSGSTSSGSSSGETETETETTHKVTEFQKGGEQLLQNKRKQVKEHTVAEKQKSCEAHKAEIDKRSKNYAAAAQRHLAVFDKIFTRVQDFQTTKQLNVANYDTLVATAKEKQTAAKTAVDALKTLDVSIDCTSTDPAGSVATLKTAVADARSALHDYRKAIKDVVVALKGASTANASDDTTESDTSTTKTTTTGGDQ